MRRVSLVLVGLLLVSMAGPVVVAQSRGGNPEAQKLKNPVPATPASIAAGLQQYQKRCQFCHAPGATGNGPLAPKGSNPPSLVDNVWLHGSSDGEIFTIIQEGVPDPKSLMKGNKAAISAQDTWNIVNYLRSLAKTKPN